MANKLTVQKELLELLEAKELALKYNRIAALFPDKGPFRRELYPKHLEFMAAGAHFSQRAFVAANRVGKTVCGAYEFACHMLGDYPEWWEGRRFLSPVDCWAVGISTEKVKEVQQVELLGELGDIGTGLIPKDRIVGKPKMRSGVPNTVESFCVRHKSGGISKCEFKTYEQGREAFQGTKRQVIWLDEEMKDPGIYSECITRLMDKFNPGIIICTFTPLFGLSDVVLSFMPDGMMPTLEEMQNRHKFVTQVSWEEVPHISDEQKAIMLAAYSPHERDARSKGVPSLGAGAIYPYSEEDIVVDYFDIPYHWAKGYGLDVGWNQTAAIWGAIDPNDGTIYLYSEHYVKQAHPAIHALAIKARGEWMTGAIDPGAEGGSQIDGKKVIDEYEEAGLYLIPAFNAREAGILNVGQRLAAGKLKVFSHCLNFLNEYRVYHRDEKGRVVKKKDHLMDATRFLCMTPEVFSQPPFDDYGDLQRDPPERRDPHTGY